MSFLVKSVLKVIKILAIFAVSYGSEIKTEHENMNAFYGALLY